MGVMMFDLGERVGYDNLQPLCDPFLFKIPPKYCKGFLLFSFPNISLQVLRESPDFGSFLMWFLARGIPAPGPSLTTLSVQEK